MLAWLFIVLLVLVLPYVAARSAVVLNAPGRARPPRSSLHLNTLAMLCVLLGLSVAVARKEHIPLFPAWQPGWVDAAAATAFLAITLTALLLRIGRLDQSSRDRLELITITDWRNPRQLIPYAAVCIMAGVAEEVAYRGVLAHLLEAKTGSSLAAIIIACIAFGAAHSVQGRWGIILTALYAALFHIVVLVTGNLYIAIIVHAVYDLIAGIIVAHLAIKRRAAAPSAKPTTQPADITE